MFKINEKDGNKIVSIMVNGVETDYKFGQKYEIDENTQQILTDAGYELEEVVIDLVKPVEGVTV